MTESVLQHIKFDLLIGCYGSFLLELPDLSAEAQDPVICRSTSLDSSGPNHGYPTFSDNKSPADALRAFADQLDKLFGKNQFEAIKAWQFGKCENYAELLEKFGAK